MPHRLSRGKTRVASRCTGQAAVEKSATAHLHLLKSKRILNISTFNVQTLNSLRKTNELVYNAIKYSIDIISIQEHRFTHEELLKYHELDEKWLLVTSSATRNSANDSIGGVGILLSPFARRSLVNIESMNDRIVIATFNGNPKTTIIATYSPTNISDDDVI